MDTLNKLAHIVAHDNQAKDIIQHSYWITKSLSPEQQEQFSVFLLDNMDAFFDAKKNLTENIEIKRSVIKKRLSDYALQLKLWIMDDSIFQFRNKLLLADNIDPDPNSPQFFWNKIIMGIYDEMIYSMAEFTKELWGKIWEKWFISIMMEVKNAVLSVELWSAIKEEIKKWGMSLLTEHSGDDMIYRKTRQILAILWFAWLVKWTIKKIMKNSLKNSKKSITILQ